MPRERQHQSIVEQDRVSFNRIEEYTSPGKVAEIVIVSFSTDHKGTIELAFTGESGIKEFSGPPSLSGISINERKYIEYVLLTIFMLLYSDAEIDESMIRYIGRDYR